jgi:hypothetical protein
MVSEAGQSLLVGRLSPDRELARTAAFALFVRVYLQQVGLLPERLSPATTPEHLPAAIAEVAGANPHVVAPFVSPDRRAALAGLDGEAVRELLGWLLAQRVHQEESQVAYELGMLALSVELPPIVVRGLREAEVHPHSRVAELPDGGGYAAVFLSTLHPRWKAPGRLRLFVGGGDAELLAGWAMLLLSRTLVPPPGSIIKVKEGSVRPLSAERFDLALVYNPAPWLASPAVAREAVSAAAFVLV